MSQGPQYALQIRDFLGVDERTHPLKLALEQSTRLVNARFGRRGVLQRRPVTRPWSICEIGAGDGLLGGVRVNLGNGMRQTVVAANWETDTGQIVSLLWEVAANEGWNTGSGLNGWPIPVDAYHHRYGWTLVNGSPVVTGLGTNLGGDNGPEAGWLAARFDSLRHVPAGEQLYTVSSIDTAGQTVTLVRDYAGTSGTTAAGGFLLFRAFSPNALWEFRQIGNRVIGTNGIDAPIEYDLERAFTLGVRPLETLTATLAATTGNLTGEADYRYRIVPVTARLDEGDAFPEDPDTVEVTTTAGQEDVTLEWSVADPKIEQVDLYRTEWIASPGEIGEYKFLARVDAHAGEYLDATADADLGAARAFAWDGRMPPRARYLEHWDGRVWAFATLDQPNYLYYSRDAMGQYWPPENAVLVGHGHRGTGLVVHARRLLAFTAQSVHEILPEIALGLRNYYAPLLTSGAGCLAPRSLCVVGDLLFFLSRWGVYVWDGSVFQLVSEDVQAQIDAVPEGRKGDACAVAWDQQLLLAVAVPGSAVNSQVLLLDTRSWTWAVWRGEYADGNATRPTLTPAFWLSHLGGDDLGEIVIGSAWSGRLYQLGSGTGDWRHDEALTATDPEVALVRLEYASPLYQAPPADRRKVLRLLTVQSRGSGRLDVTVEVDESRAQVLSIQGTADADATGKLWNFLWDQGTVSVQALTFLGQPAGLVIGTTGLVSAGVLVGDTFRLTSGTTGYPVVALGYPGYGEALVIGGWDGGTLPAGQAYWIYRYDEPEGLWFAEALQDAGKVRRDLSRDLVGEVCQVRIVEDGAGAEFELVGYALEYDVMSGAVPKGVVSGG